MEKTHKKGIREAQSACVQQAINVYFILCFQEYYAYSYTWLPRNLIQLLIYVYEKFNPLNPGGGWFPL